MERRFAFISMVVAVGSLGVAEFGTGGISIAGDAPPGGHEHVMLSEALKDIPGTKVTAMVVAYEPGGRSPAHHHAGSVFAYVIQGAVRSQNSATGPARVYQTGESFFEPAGSVHLVSENASASEPARLLAVFVAPASAQLTTPER